MFATTLSQNIPDTLSSNLYENLVQDTGVLSCNKVLL